MIIEYTENADLNFDAKDFEKLSTGIVLFPETLEECAVFKEGITSLEELIDRLIEFQNR